MGMRTSKFMHWQVKGGVHILASQRAISTLIIFTGAIYLHEFQSPHRSINYHKHILYGYMWLYVLGSPIFFFLFYLIHLPVLFPWWIFNAWGAGGENHSKCQKQRDSKTSSTNKACSRLTFPRPFSEIINAQAQTHGWVCEWVCRCTGEKPGKVKLIPLNLF